LPASKIGPFPTLRHRGEKPAGWFAKTLKNGYQGIGSAMQISLVSHHQSARVLEGIQVHILFAPAMAGITDPTGNYNKDRFDRAGRQRSRCARSIGHDHVQMLSISRSENMTDHSIIGVDQTNLPFANAAKWLSDVFTFVTGTAPAVLSAGLESQRLYAQLAELDDRALSALGIERTEIAAFVANQNPVISPKAAR
jgi:hypothetical protein